VSSFDRGGFCSLALGELATSLADDLNGVPLSKCSQVYALVAGRPWVCRQDQGPRGVQEGEGFNARKVGDEPHFATLPCGACKRFGYRQIHQPGDGPAMSSKIRAIGRLECLMEARTAQRKNLRD
jgi:hypothetical protein